MQSLRIGTPSPLEGSVVWYSDVVKLPHMHDRVQVIFSSQVIRYRSYWERRELSRIFFYYLAWVCGNHCSRDPTHKTCRYYDNSFICTPLQLEFDHLPGQGKIRHVKDYKHAIHPGLRHSLLVTYYNEAAKCCVLCPLHHRERHTQTRIISGKP
jgi:hypothetical protein